MYEKGVPLENPKSVTKTNLFRLYWSFVALVL